MYLESVKGIKLYRNLANPILGLHRYHYILFDNE